MLRIIKLWLIICISAKTPSDLVQYSHQKMWIFVRYVISPFHPSFVCSLCSVSLLSVKIWMEGTCLIKTLFLHDYWTKLDGVFAVMQIISYNFIILKHIQINSLLMLKLRLSFLGDNLYAWLTWLTWLTTQNLFLYRKMLEWDGSVGAMWMVCPDDLVYRLKWGSHA